MAPLLIIAKVWNQSTCLTTDDLTKKKRYINKMEQYNSSIKKNEWNWRSSVMLNKRNQAQKDKYHIFLSYAESQPQKYYVLIVKG
jgi:hypothetical protein